MVPMKQSVSHQVPQAYRNWYIHPQSVRIIRAGFAKRGCTDLDHCAPGIVGSPGPSKVLLKKRSFTVAALLFGSHPRPCLAGHDVRKPIAYLKPQLMVPSFLHGSLKQPAATKSRNVRWRVILPCLCFVGETSLHSGPSTPRLVNRGKYTGGCALFPHDETSTLPQPQTMRPTVFHRSCGKT